MFIKELENYINEFTFAVFGFLLTPFVSVMSSYTIAVVSEFFNKR